MSKSCIKTCAKSRSRYWLPLTVFLLGSFAFFSVKTTSIFKRPETAAVQAKAVVSDDNETKEIDTKETIAKSTLNIEKISYRHFTLPSVTNPDKQVNQDIFKGKVTLVNVFASWCGPCRQETDRLTALSKEYSDLFWVGLNINDSLEEAQRMLQIYGNPYHETIYDHRGSLARELGVRATPELLILDKEGYVQYRHLGKINAWTWNEEVLPIIKSLQ